MVFGSSKLGELLFLPVNCLLIILNCEGLALCQGLQTGSVTMEVTSQASLCIRTIRSDLIVLSTQHFHPEPSMNCSRFKVWEVPFCKFSTDG